jgi:hypothetical protein
MAHSHEGHAGSEILGRHQQFMEADKQSDGEKARMKE